MEILLARLQEQTKMFDDMDPGLENYQDIIKRVHEHIPELAEIGEWVRSIPEERASFDIEVHSDMIAVVEHHVEFLVQTGCERIERTVWFEQEPPMFCASREDLTRELVLKGLDLYASKLIPCGRIVVIDPTPDE